MSIMLVLAKYTKWGRVRRVQSRHIATGRARVKSSLSILRPRSCAFTLLSRSKSCACMRILSCFVFIYLFCYSYILVFASYLSRFTTSSLAPPHSLASVHAAAQYMHDPPLSLKINTHISSRRPPSSTRRRRRAAAAQDVRGIV
jgi:hypothetical protein